MFVAKAQFVRTGDHAVAFIATEFTHRELEIFGAKSGRNDGAWSKPGYQNAGTDIWCATDNLNQAAFQRTKLSITDASIDFTKMKMSPFNVGTFNYFCDIDILVFFRQRFGTFNFDQARANQLHQVGI